jgi:hypothetical protein
LERDEECDVRGAAYAGANAFVQHVLVRGPETSHPHDLFYLIKLDQLFVVMYCHSDANYLQMFIRLGPEREEVLAKVKLRRRYLGPLPILSS